MSQHVASHDSMTHKQGVRVVMCCTLMSQSSPSSVAVSRQRGVGGAAGEPRAHATQVQQLTRAAARSSCCPQRAGRCGVPLRHSSAGDRARTRTCTEPQLPPRPSCPRAGARARELPWARGGGLWGSRLLCSCAAARPGRHRGRSGCSVRLATRAAVRPTRHQACRTGHRIPAAAHCRCMLLLQVLFWDTLLHASGPNTSRHTRRAWMPQFCSRPITRLSDGQPVALAVPLRSLVAPEGS